MGFRRPSNPNLSCEVVERDGAGKGSPFKVDETAASSREVKMEDRLYSFSIFVGIFP